MNQEIIKQFGNQLRVRVCGICVESNKILLINHAGMNVSGEFWSPPGGGLQFGETIEECLKREFFEETNTLISIGKFLTVRELIKIPLHAIELFYEVKIESGMVEKGHDPELIEQIIKEIKWLTFDEVLSKSEEDFANSLQEIISKYQP